MWWYMICRRCWFMSFTSVSIHRFGIVPEDVHVDFVIDIPFVFLSFGDNRNHLVNPGEELDVGIMSFSYPTAEPG